MRTALYYDGSCPLCRREVDHYRRLDRQQRVRWVDISREPEALAPLGIGFVAAMRRLHATDEDGRLVSGAAAFLVIWRQLPGYRYLARAVTRLGLIPLLDWCYTGCAAWRFRRRCAAGVCANR